MTIDRRKALLNIIQDNNSARVTDLAKRFSVSTETIRKDLIVLEESGLVVRGHGGAIISEGHYDLPLGIKLQTNNESKRTITEKCVSLLSGKSSVFIGPGSTETMISKLLLRRNDIKIFTNSIMIAQIYCDSKMNNNNVIFLGGSIESISMGTVGSLTLDSIDAMFFDYAILGTSGFEKMEGPSTFSYGELSVNKKVIQRSRKSIVIGDSSKFNRTSLFLYARWEEVDILVTNRDENNEAMIEEIGQKVEIVFAD